MTAPARRLGTAGSLPEAGRLASALSGRDRPWHTGARPGPPPEAAP